MKQKIQKQTSARENTFLLADAACMLAISALWEQQLIPEEVLELKERFLMYVEATRDPYGRYLQLCHRILICWKEKNDQLKIPPAIKWYTCYKKGVFMRTVLKYVAIISKQKKEPSYLLCWKAIAEAFLEMTEAPSGDIYRFWINWLLDKDAIEEMKLFAHAGHSLQK